MMKVYFDNVNFSSATGPNTFGSRLAHELSTSCDVKIVGPNDNYDIFLCFIEPTHKPRNDSIFCQRLDGIWFKPEQFESHNQLIKWAYRQADGVIWQSEFDKKMTAKWWGERMGVVIHNGIELQKVKIDKEAQDIKNNYDKIFVCSANWHRQKRLKENIELFQKLSSPSDALFVMGKNPDEKILDPRVIFTGHLKHEKCLQLYSIATWMIHLAWLDHCPNVVVEALSQGCPVICTDSGGTHEIVKNNGAIIPELQQYEFELCDYDDPPPLNVGGKLASRTPVDNSHLDIKECAQRYFNFFNLLRKN